MGKWIFGATLALALAASPSAGAFCGFYVAQSDKALTNDASMVVMMRAGTRTVLSMQNDYAGPPEDFAMVVPVPVVLHEENVKTLPHEIFAHVDLLDSPRLVEYWEQDPCPSYEDYDADNKEGGTGTRAKGEAGSMGNPNTSRMRALVTIEAKFAVGEYDIVILAATDSLALDAWLHQNGYHIPAGTADVLRPYVAAGSLFFVAKVDTHKVQFSGGRASLSPLRFHYDADRFSLPVRLGLLNSSGNQDLVVHILASQRYDVANYPRATIPTNLELDESVEHRFPELYAALFDRTIEKNPRAVVTEYSWSSSSCDPCPSPTLSSSELNVLGADVLPKSNQLPSVLTRLHTRYSKDTLGDDLVFVPVGAIEGGRGEPPNRTDAAPTPGDNNFQGRYIVRHPWKGPMACASPQRGNWGGPPASNSRPVLPPRVREPGVARGKLDLAASLRTDASAVGVVHTAPAVATAASAPPTGGRFRVGMTFGLLLGIAMATGITARARRRDPSR